MSDVMQELFKQEMKRNTIVPVHYWGPNAEKHIEKAKAQAPLKHVIHHIHSESILLDPATILQWLAIDKKYGAQSIFVSPHSRFDWFKSNSDAKYGKEGVTEDDAANFLEFFDKELKAEIIYVPKVRKVEANIIDKP